ncbi:MULTISPECIES: histidine phosphatase family protein [Acetobacter]|uniref:Histidine phosphatase family protein n=1 Tax=Acetobacter thailandicus TaxID=1502842 RepID=A0ABT3QH21_9PROT|nr:MULTISPECIES: histidine phosphatase family protein [Acetobacter]MBS0960907.1 histidine phosphatase family protein [Acetobacter thailandicus]MBS0980051.1 histidine phosphatase family protein [Acetobacter thailandicus]MBS0986287.1 histidine phosphatase family protein [Acetobacter thailandicus]MBS1003061.1 histidine phosphatase family protein [Acetobacter thailandicus]MCX2564579.1 histidine phosphatase family protein [Acetobacter thailandicus]
MPLLELRSYWYLRHGQTDWNRDGLSQGRTNIPLNITGAAQAQAAVELVLGGLKKHVPFTHIVSSPLDRAFQTAVTVRDGLIERGLKPMPVTTDEHLQEVCFGEQEGQPMGDWYDSWIAGEYTPDGAEKFSDLRERAVRAVNRATHGGGVPLIVGHGAVFRALRAAMHLPANVRLPNATPLWLEPGRAPNLPWHLTMMSE